MHQEEKHHIPVQNLTLWFINSTKDLYKGFEIHPISLSEDVNNSVPVLDNILILAESCKQARIDGHRVASILQKLDFILSHDKYQFESTHLFTHLGLTFNTREMTSSLQGCDETSGSLQFCQQGSSLSKALPMVQSSSG